jgi:hypothetical protein
MNRRHFLKKSVAATSLIAGSALFLSSCRRNLKSDLMQANPLSDSHTIGMLSPDGYKILYYASCAPSGHNSQPWFVRLNSPSDWVVGSDSNRWLPIVDDDNREALLSIGAFVENLVQAAAAFGYEVETSIIAKNTTDPDVVGIRLKKTNHQMNTLNNIITRRTVKSHMLDKELNPSDIEYFTKLSDGHFYYFPRDSRHSRLMAKEAIDNFVIQLNNKHATAEMADWTRLKDKEAIKFRDGLTPEGMEISGIAGWYVRNFMDKKEVRENAYKNKAIEKVRQQATQGGGWIVITSDGQAVKDLIESGRRFQRMALVAREKMIAIHPMTQTLEEKNGQKNIRENHPSTPVPQFILRVGYLTKYPDPVSLRRPVEWFVRA